jgi:hypothetical protein
MDGARSIVDWTAARLDVTRETALDLARVARSNDVETLVTGDASPDRVVVRCHLVEVGASKEALAESDRYDIAGVRRLVARHRRIGRRSERDASMSRGIWFEESWDNEMMRLWGRLPGRDGRLVREALDEIAETVPVDTAPTRPQRMADALVMLSQGDRPDTQPAATVIVDARLAAPSDGAAGVAVLNGPSVGADALEASCATGLSKSSASPMTASHWASAPRPAVSHPSCAASSWPATVVA